VLVALLLAACSSGGEKSHTTVTAADAYNAAIRWYLGTVPAPTGTADTKPAVVYIAPESGKAINVGTQAAVAAEMADMKDVVVVRFADVRDDALDVDVDGKPVKDDGVLLLVGEIDEGQPPLDMNVGVYRNADDQALYSMTITRSGESFVATSVTEVAQG